MMAIIKLKKPLTKEMIKDNLCAMVDNWDLRDLIGINTSESVSCEIGGYVIKDINLTFSLKVRTEEQG